MTLNISKKTSRGFEPKKIEEKFVGTLQEFFVNGIFSVIHSDQLKTRRAEVVKN